MRASRWRDLGATPWARFDVDTTLDLVAAAARDATATGARARRPCAAFLEMARLPGDRPLAVPKLEEIGAVMRDRSAELVVAGRVPRDVAGLETETACRVRCLIEERGMRSARRAVPRSILVGDSWIARPRPSWWRSWHGWGRGRARHAGCSWPAVAASSDAADWPPPRRSASPPTSATRPGSRTPWLRELTVAAEAASVPFLFGGHALSATGCG